MESKILTHVFGRREHTSCNQDIWHTKRDRMTLVT